jgi:Tfp pilus assembly protein PilE
MVLAPRRYQKAMNQTLGYSKEVAMRRRRIRDHRGITDVDVMWLIIIPWILAAIAVPLYTGYVERARVIEATSIMEAIVISQKEEKKRTTNFYRVSLDGGVTDIETFMHKGIDVTDTTFFTYETAATGVKPDDGFTITATSTAAFGTPGGTLTYTYDPIAAPPGSWAADGTIILNDMVPSQP